MVIRDRHGCCFCFNYKSWSLAMQRHHPAPTSRTLVTSRSCFWIWTFSKKKINLCVWPSCALPQQEPHCMFFLFLFCVHFLLSKIKGRCSGIFSRVGFREPNSRREIRGIASLAKLFRSQSYFYLRQKNSHCCYGGKGIFGSNYPSGATVVHSYETRCRGERWAPREGTAPKLSCRLLLLCRMKAELQLARAFRVVRMGWGEEKPRGDGTKPFVPHSPQLQPLL